MFNRFLRKIWWLDFTVLGLRLLVVTKGLFLKLERVLELSEL